MEGQCISLETILESPPAHQTSSDLIRPHQTSADLSRTHQINPSPQDKKRVEREKRKQDSAYAEVVRGLHGSDHTFPANNTLPRPRPRLRSEDTKKSLNQTLESTYTAEALQDYLATMVAVPQAVGAGPSFRRTQRQIRRVQAQGRGEEPGPQVVKEYEHRGKWAFSAVEDCDAWSCCMNPQQDSRGCSSRVVVDQRRWNTSS